MTLCRWLRWKTWYGVESFSEADLAELFSRNEVPYTCLRTCQAWGPDEGAAVPEGCTPERGCFEVSRKLVRRVS